MTEKSKRVDLTVSVSFPEGFSESFSDLISRRLLDFEGDVVDALTRRLDTVFTVTPSSGEDKSSVVCNVSLDEFDERLQRAFKRALEALSAPPLTEAADDYASTDTRCADDEG